MDDERIERALRAGPPDEPAYVPMGTAIERPSRIRTSSRRGLGSLLATASIAAALLVALLVIRPLVVVETGLGTHDLLADVKAAGRIRIAVTTGSPQLKVPGSGYAGFDLDVAQAIGARLGVPVQVDLVDTAEIEKGHWADGWDLALDSQVSTDQRAELLQVGAPYYMRSAAIFVPAGSSIARPADLAGRAVCVVGGGLAERWLRATLDLVGGRLEPSPAGVAITTAGTAADCMAAVGRGDVAAFVADWGYEVPSVPAGLTQLADAPFLGPAAPAVDRDRPGADRLLVEVDRIVGDLRADGTLRGLSERRIRRSGSHLAAAALSEMESRRVVPCIVVGRRSSCRPRS